MLAQSHPNEKRSGVVDVLMKINPWIYKQGDRVIYTVYKRSDSPGPRAKKVFPAANGDMYSYRVDKFWVIDEIQDDGKLLLRTRRGKTHLISPDDPQLRRARWWERLWYNFRFPDFGSGN